MLMVNNTLGLSQQRFRRNLYKYVNGEFLSWQEILVSMISPITPFRRHAKKMSHQYKKVLINPSQQQLYDRLTIEPYRGKNSHVLKMMEFLSGSKVDLIGAYVHGSLGTYEEVPFSDFDALIILKDDVFEIPERLSRVACKICSAQSIMFDFDPLQHHGWVVLSETDLRSYPEERFPRELFRHAKSLLPEQGGILEICTQDSGKDIRQGFQNLCNSVAKRIARRRSIGNIFELKILLSQFMLLPSLYIENRDGRGIYKKFSFEAARVDFTAEDWSIMDEVSSIREKWHYSISPLWRKLMTKPSRLSRSFARTFSPAVPKAIEEVLTDELYKRMSHLITLMLSKIK
jgi:hypothetical protein